MKKISVILFILSLTSCYIGEELPPDQNVWTYAYPTDAGLDDQSLFEMDSAIKNGFYEQITGVIIIKDDQLVFENYYNYGSRNQLTPIGRLTFPILVLALDLFINDGYIHLDEPIYNYLPEYESLFESDSLKRLITIRHLLTFKSGLVWNEMIGTHNDLFQVENAPDWARYVLEKPMEAPPGFRTVVNSGTGIILAKILQNRLEDGSLLDYLKVNLFAKIGIEEVVWEEDPNGTLNGCNGLSLKVRDLTRIGYLMLNEGRWTNKKRVIGRGWILDITSKKIEVDQYYHFGYTWWLFSDLFNRNFLNLNESKAYFAAGESGQNLYIIPQENMVVCITAENYNVNFVNRSLHLFVKSLESLQPALANN